MDYREAVSYLDAHIGRGMEPGLDRMETLLDLMGSPESGYPIVHIAGTNGKTSTARFATMAAVAHGLTTGTFTSPHLERVEERLGVNGYDAGPDEFAQAVADVAAFVDLFEQRSGQAPTYFELTALSAFAWFADQAVDLAVVEVGLGGRLDATNAARGDVAVVTSIGRDHVEFLGSSLAGIAAEKLAIVEPEAPLIVGRLPHDAMEVARSVAAAENNALLRLGEEFEVEAMPSVGGWNVIVDGVYSTYDGLDFPIHGRHQVDNLAVATVSIEALFGRALDAEALRHAAAVCSTPGRMEQAATDPLVLLDGAHNADGFQALAAALTEEFPSTRWVAVVGATGSKDLEPLIGGLGERLMGLVATTVESPRSMDPEDLAMAARRLGVGRVSVEHDPALAVEWARGVTGDEGVLVTGSLYLVGAVRAILTGGDRMARQER